MAKTSGLAWTTLGVDTAAGVLTDIRNDTTSLEFSTPRATWEITGVDKSAIERTLLLSDFSATMSGVFNPLVSHLVFKTVSSTTAVRTLSLAVEGQTLSNEVVLTDYPLSRSDAGELTWKVEAMLADGTVPTWS